jgi:hypothetical protein
MLSKEQLSIVLRRQIHSGRDQKAATIDWQIATDRLATSALQGPHSYLINIVCHFLSARLWAEPIEFVVNPHVDITCHYIRI